MVNKTFIPEGEAAPASQIGATLEALAATIAARRDADEASYTYRLLTGNVDGVLKKVMEESGEVALAAKDVEGWATSSLAAAVALEATEAGGTTTGVETADDGADFPLSVQLPPEYGEAVDHLRYEAADVVYHLLVVLERYGITLDEFAAELNNRMTEGERPRGAVRLHDEFVRRGK
ncbi:phosphoribosyl-ATP pyrophosphatase [Adlercreutzia equolifaciens]|uniref:phosphoribosyl-ATP pyrophosphatase n=1 Tax=Adlercreutzia equolifaciens TaxID=446660 RepID=UPI001CC6842B|nr:phosphoribosyl-ATP diphosphatase [Adlercreutzia equolifaciens]GJC76441.1 hypothetical protein Aeq9CBH6_17760 [Adlercreutzia equolifaciens]